MQQPASNHEPLAVAGMPRLFVGQVPTDKAESDLQPVFEAFGQIEKLTLVRGPDGKSRGCAMVQFKRWADAERAMNEVSGTSPLEGGKGRPLVVHFANPRRTMGSQAAENAIAPRKLFVGQIPKTAGEAEVLAVFAPFGEVQSVNILKSKGIHAGCAFVQYASWTACEGAIEALHERLVMPGCEHPLVVKFADAKKMEAAPLHKRGLGMLGGMLMGAPHPAMMAGYDAMGQMAMHMGQMAHMPGQMAHMPSLTGMTPMHGMGSLLQGSPLGGMGIATPMPMHTGLASRSSLGGVDNGSSDSLLAENTQDGSTTPSGSGAMHADATSRMVHRIGSTPTMSSNGSGGNLQAMALPPHVAASLGAMAGYMGAENGMHMMNHAGLLLAGPGRGIKLGRGVPDPAAYAHKLFIGQIPYEAVEQDLWALFSTAGDVLELAILRSQGRSKGCAFLTYATRAQAMSAIGTFNGRLVGHNKKLVVKFADQKAALRTDE